MRLVCLGLALTSTSIGAGWEAHRRSTAPGGLTRIIFSFQLGAKTYSSTGRKLETPDLEFEQRALRLNGDPSPFLWDLRQLLDRANPDLTEDAKTVLLSRQFIKGFPSTVCLRLLEGDPTPTLDKMTEFVHYLRATRCDETHDIAAVCSSSEELESPHASLLYPVNQLTAAVAALAFASRADQHQ